MPQPTSSSTIARLKDILKQLLHQVAYKSSTSPPVISHSSLTSIPPPPAPPLPSSIATHPLLDSFKPLAGQNDTKYCLECASRELLYEMIATFERQQTPVTTDPFIDIFAFFDIILILSELDIGDQQLPFAIIEETLDTQPIEGCKRIFSYLESRIERLTVGVDGTKGKGIILLRLCNELLRRLSKSEDTVFCGRIFVFLTKSFPLSERSGVNLRGEFHVDNRTTYDEGNATVQPSEGPSHEKSDTTADGVDAMEITPSEAASAADACHSLYSTLWSAQHDFAEPTRLFQKANLDKFRASLETVVKAFKTAIDEHGYNVPSTTSDLKRTAKRKRAETEEDEYEDDQEKYNELDNYNPKYLTSRELFDLEVRDLVFRRHILVQFLIVIEFLLTLSPKYKKYLEADAKNRSVQFAYTLSEEDDKWVESAKKDIVGALNHKSGMDGLLFSRTVDSVLSREKNWVKWKADNCVSFEVPPVNVEETAASATTGGENSQIPRNVERGMGAPALSRVWFDSVSDADAMDSLKDTQRIGLPEYREFNNAIEGYILDKDFATDQEKEDLDDSIANKSWRALRIASRDRFHLFKVLDDELSIKSLIAAEDGLVDKKDSEKEPKRDLPASFSVTT
ncbi:hypothetical protein ABW19_dt0209503 [Dactylella cylindrospora]|nr:hypothetical protein ABW19_dt0209503 [Dactylella cylindrospora]